jgi:hypothetical protein
MRRREVDTLRSVPGIVQEVVNSPGRQLEPEVRLFAEQSFQASFDQVRIHTDSRACESAREVGAIAYTVGQDIVFRSGAYSPHNASGFGLVLHELAHVVQQSGNAIDFSNLQIGSANDPLEQQADDAAASVLSSSAPAISCGHVMPLLQKAVSKKCLPPELLFGLGNATVVV